MAKRSTKIPPEEVEEMLAELAEHFGEPVRPVSQYCNALTEWARVSSNKEAMIAFSQVKKSNLLARMIYGGEKLRTKQCPRHKGEWFTIPGLADCEHNCGGTGWLMEPEDEERYRKMIKPVDTDE